MYSVGRESNKLKINTSSAVKREYKDVSVTSAKTESHAAEDNSRLKYGRGKLSGNFIHFTRSPRVIQDIQNEELNILDAPKLVSKPEINWLSTLLPSISTLSVAIIMTVLMSNRMMLLYTLPMTLAGILISIINYRGQKKKYELQVARRAEKYQQYINEKEQYLKERQRYQLQAMNAANPETAECLSVVENVKPTLWDRSPEDEDFLRVRLGTGRMDSCVELHVAPKEIAIEEDELAEEPQRLYNQYSYLNDAPVCYDFLNDSVCGLVGRWEDQKRILSEIVIQLTAHHCYTDLRIVLVQRAGDNSLTWLRYLPHVTDDERKSCYITENAPDHPQKAKQAEILIKYFAGELEAREIAIQDADSQDEPVKPLPYYLFIILDPGFLRKGGKSLHKYMPNAASLGLGMIIAANTITELPRECCKIIRISSQKGELFDRRQASAVTNFVCDRLHENSFSPFAKKMWTIINEDAIAQFSLPKLVTFLEMYGVNTIEELQIKQLWRSNNPVKSLAVPIGLDPNCDPFLLDLHEKKHGPHGLVAGTTGSGKSEFLMTLILSLAVNYHPDEVAFVLIDYKGGGLAGAFDDPERGIHLPHLLATITNLDGATIRRSLVSIESELGRRQRIFNEAKSVSDTNTLDIYDYQELYRQKRVAEPLPHLFIISDEFAELKQQQPEFMEKLISIARIGRSLGVHLILATQKPGGIVNDQILSNTKFRICLKVQNRNDSMEVLGRAEASMLKETGRFYLQVGNDELFVMGQSAWSGAAYDGTTTSTSEANDGPDLFGESQAREQQKNLLSGGSDGKTALKTQLLNIVKYMSDICAESGVIPRSLWKPALQDAVSMEDLNAQNLKVLENEMGAAIALVDDPENQQQFAWRIDLYKCGHILVAGDSGSGKTQFCQSLLLYLASHYGPEDLNFYVLDYSSRLMGMMKSLPHCGAVLTDEDTPRLSMMFDIIDSIIAERKKLFSDLGVDSFESAHLVHGIPLILVVIDNFSGLNTTKEGAEVSYKMPEYLKNSAKYGVIYVLTESYLNNIPSRVKQAVGTTIALHQKEKFDYRDLLYCNVDYMPPQKPGRGLYNFEGRPLEMQLASFWPDINGRERTILIKEKIRKLCEQYDGKRTALRLPVFAQDAEYIEFADQFKLGRFPIGYSQPEGKPVAIPMKQFSMLSIYFGNPHAEVPITENVLYALKREDSILWIVKAAGNSVFDIENTGFYEKYCKDALLVESETDELTKMWRSLAAVIAKRKAVLEKYCTESGLDYQRNDVSKFVFHHMYENTKPLFIFIENLADLCLALDSIGKLTFATMFRNANLLNMYFVAGFKPDDCERAEGNTVFNRYNPDNNILLFGGQTNRQKLFELPDHFIKTETVQYNKGVMIYHNQAHELLMPCGQVEVETVDEDDLNIFA